MTIPASRPDMAPVVVIGAGVGGLAAAQALQAAGAGTIVLESSARPGAASSRWNAREIVWM